MTYDLTAAMSDLSTDDLAVMADHFYTQTEKAAERDSRYVRLYAILAVAAIDALAAR